MVLQRRLGEVPPAHEERLEEKFTAKLKECADELSADEIPESVRNKIYIALQAIVFERLGSVGISMSPVNAEKFERMYRHSPAVSGGRAVEERVLQYLGNGEIEEAVAYTTKQFRYFLDSEFQSSGDSYIY